MNWRAIINFQNLKRVLHKIYEISVPKYLSTKKMLPDTILTNYLNSSFLSTNLDIELNLPKKKLQNLMEITIKTWEELGKKEPHWSVLTNKKFNARNIYSNHIVFYRTGEEEWIRISRLFNRVGLSMQTIKESIVLELGAGVGRVSIPLARNSKKLICFDVSGSHLQILKDTMLQEKIENVLVFRLDQLSHLTFKKKFDVFISILTLQHNSPPVQKFMLEEILENLNSGGWFLFQTVTHNSGYNFRYEDYILSNSQLMEIHCLPMPDIFRILSDKKCEVNLVLRDNYAGSVYESYTFIGRKN